MTSKEEDRLAASPGFIRRNARNCQAYRRRLSRCTAWQSRTVQLSPPCGPRASSKSPSDWSRALIARISCPSRHDPRLPSGSRSGRGWPQQGCEGIRTGLARRCWLHRQREGTKMRRCRCSGCRSTTNSATLEVFGGRRADRPGLLGSAALFYAIGVAIVGILTVVCMVRAWPCGHSFWLWLAWVAAFVLYVGAAVTLGVTWCREIPNV